MDDKQMLQRLMQKAEAVSKAQRYYFKNRNDVNKRLAIQTEKELDDYLTHLRKIGYRPEEQPQSSNQSKMF